LAAADEQSDPGASPPQVQDELELGTSPPALPEIVQVGNGDMPAPRAQRRRLAIPAALYLVTCVSTVWAGAFRITPLGGIAFYWTQGLIFGAAVMTILTLHELGHFLQAVRYRVPASLPFFLPMPLSPFGTMGAVILMPARVNHRRALYDIGISGPLAGLVPAVACTFIGLTLPVTSDTAMVFQHGPGGSPLLFTWMYNWLHGPLGPDEIAALHPLAFAGWIGLFLTALNLLPVGQLDGGHVLYALLRRKGHYVAMAVYVAMVAAVVVLGYWMWWLMLVLVFLTDVRHPPTADDEQPLGAFRTVLGWLTLLLFPLGFTPTPFFLAG
jgi:membrane-associated protease RseP (regulator of RpoE activity)